jgi:hypothetical protein
MASTASDLSTLDGLFLVQYNDSIKDAIPQGAILIKEVEFVEMAKLGEEFRTPVNVSYEGGVSYLGENGGLQQLQDAIAGQMKEAVVKGSELNIRGFVTNKALAASLGGNKKAFKTATAQKVLGLDATLKRRLETSCWYGQDSLATVEAVSDLGSSRARITISRATFAPGFWQGVESHRLDAFAADGTKHSATAGLSIYSVDLENRYVTVTYVTSVAEVQVGDTLHWLTSRAGASTWNEMAGVKKIFSNTGSMFGIDATTATVWKGNTYASAGLPSTAMLQKAAVKVANRGYYGKLKAVIPTAAWAELNIDETQLVRRKQGDSKAESGIDELTIRSAAGPMEIVPSPFIKEGDFFLLPMDELLRGGALEPTFSLDGQRFFRWLDGYNGYELQAMCDQFIFCNKPSFGLYGSGLSYSD